MDHLIVIFLWIFINSGSGSLQNIANNGIEKYKWQQPDDNMIPVTAEYILPEEAQQAFHDKFENLIQRNVKPEPCLNNKLKDELSKGNQQVNLPNRRSHEEDLYLSSNKFDSANLQSQELPSKMNQSIMINNGNRRSEFQNPILKNSDYDLLSTIDTLDIMRSPKDNFQDSNFMVTEDEKEKTRDINDFRRNADWLMNLLTSTIKPISNIQCDDKNKFRSVNDISRRFLIPENKIPENTNNLQHINGNLNTNNDGGKIFNNFKRPSDNLMFGINRSPIRENNAYRTESNQNINELDDPTIGRDISYMNKGELMLMDYDKVCYACSSANNPTCISPDRRTTVKYCRKGINSCSTKSFKTGSTITLIRDCSNSCDESEVQGLGLKYQSCSICHSDLCNNATYNNAYGLKLTLPILALIILVTAFI